MTSGDCERSTFDKLLEAVKRIVPLLGNEIEVAARVLKALLV